MLESVEGDGKRMTINRTARLAYIIKAWNAYIAGRQVSMLKWSKRETFPQIA
jgi:hypothetical protein